MKKIYIISFFIILLVGCSDSKVSLDENSKNNKAFFQKDYEDYTSKVKFISFSNSKLYVDNKLELLNNYENYSVSNVIFLKKGKHTVKIETAVVNNIELSIDITQDSHEINLIEKLKDIPIQPKIELLDIINTNKDFIAKELFMVAKYEQFSDKYMDKAVSDSDNLIKKISAILEINKDSYNKTEFIGADIEGDFSLIGNNMLQFSINVKYKYELKGAENVFLENEERIMPIIKIDAGAIKIIDVEV